MADAATPQHDGDLSDWGYRSWFALPSWVISLALHAGFLVILAFTLPQPSLSGAKAGSEREVGIYTKGAHDAVAERPAETPSETAVTAPAGAAKPQEAEATLKMQESPPAPLELPSRAVGRIGPGPALPATAGIDVQGMIKPSRAGPGGGAIAGKGGTSFFDSRATGTRFVYVLDRSGSMGSHNALGVAKAELLASLEKLDASQQFQIVFYDHEIQQLNWQGNKAGLVFATDVNRTLAGQFVQSVQPRGGTDRLRALLAALALGPEVIFFLSDADDLSSGADLDKIKQRNRNGCQIHVVEFGLGANLNDDNFLRKLARQNHGTFSYRDVTKFDRDRD